MWLPAALFLVLQVAADPLDEGRKALDENRLDQAQELFTQALAKDPNDYAAHFHLALTYSLKNDDAHAIPEYRKTLELKPGLYQGLLNLGISLLRVGQAGEAVRPLEQAVEQKPDEAQPRAKLAGAYLALQRYGEAEAAYQALSAANPKSAEAEFGLAKAFSAEGKLDEAAPHFENAAAREPKFRDALLELAGLYEKAKRTDEAITIYKQFPENAAAQLRLGDLLLDAKQYAAAIPRLEAAVAKSPTSDNRLALAAAYRMSRQPEKEAEVLQKSVAQEPGNYNLRMTYGRTLRDQRKFPAAGLQFYAAAQVRPESAEAWNEMAAALILAEDYAHGLAALDKVKALHKESPGNQFLRAITLDRLKQLKPALESYEEFLASDGGKNPDQEFQARQRARILRLELSKK